MRLTARGKNWARYSGLFVLLKHKLKLAHKAIRQAVLKAWEYFKQIILPPVPSQV